MREPYRTIFEGFEDHWLLAPYLQGDEPDWPALLAHEMLPALSSGEMAILDMACWMKGPASYLDDTHKVRLAQALLLTCGDPAAW